MDTLPCGCKIDVVGDTFVIEPCSARCSNFIYAIEEGTRRGLGISQIDDPDVSER